jgi:hypothetical protein
MDPEETVDHSLGRDVQAGHGVTTKPQAAGLGETPRRRHKNATPGGKPGVLGTAFWNRETGTHRSRAAHQLGNG